MKNRIPLIVTALMCVFTLPALSKDKQAPDTATVVASAPGKARIAEETRATATVEAIDLQQRRVTLKGAKGNVFTVAAGPDVRNLERLKVGDQVVVRYIQALSLTLKKDGKDPLSKIETIAGARAVPGDPPGGVIGKQVEVTANVIAVNAKTHVVTLQGPEHRLDLKVRDPAQLKRIKVGDQVQAVYIEAVALSVDTAPARK